MTMCAEVRRVLTEEEREKVFRFRYDVYVKEMGKYQKHADHRRKRIEEPMDRNGAIFAAFEGEDVVGTVRVNWCDDPDAAVYRALYEMDRLAPFMNRRITTTTKLMVRPDRRRSLVGMRLPMAAFDFALAIGGYFDFVNCNPKDGLLPFFLKMGYRRLFPNVVHPEYGECIPLILVVRDRAHLENVGSPFARLLPSDADDMGSVAHFHAGLSAARLRASCG